jgi:hypothetical protein
MQADGNLVLNGPSDPYPYSRLPVATQKWDSSGRTYLAMETEGNLVVYAPGALWTSVLWVGGTSWRSARPAGTDDWLLGDLARSLRLTPEGQPAQSTRPGPDWSGPR